MRFQRLDLIKYGKFDGRSVDFPTARQDFHVIVGPNEAGKSTLRSAILDVLFGIPARSKLDFRHPLNELRLGALISNMTGSFEFHRAKAQKQTLRSPQDAVLPDAALTPFLGSTDRGFFDQMFGLDHARLVAGGNSILSAENDVGQVLFQSAAGVASLGKIRDALMAEADKLWATRKSGDRAYYIAADQFEKASAALKVATVRTKVWAEANGRLEAVKEELEREREHHQTLQGKRARLERVRRLAPFLCELRDFEGQLAELGAVIELPIDAASTLANAERELSTARQLLELRSAEVKQATESLAMVSVDNAMLELAADVTKLDELRLQYGAHDRDIERREKEVAALWQDVCDACNQLGWNADSEEGLAARLPTRLVRRELEQLARERSGLIQGLKAAEQAERAKVAEIESLERQLAGLASGEAKPALRAALARARALGNPDTVLQKQQLALHKAKSGLDGASLALGNWGGSLAELAALHPPSAQTLTRLLQERQSLLSDRKAILARRNEQKALVAGLELQVAQFQALHHPTTQEDVLQARELRGVSWRAIKTGDIAIQDGATQFEATMLRADELADGRLENVEEATELQSLLYQWEREKQTLLVVEAQWAGLNQEIQQFDAQWHESAAALGLTGVALEDAGDWLLRRGKVLDAVAALQEAESDFKAVSASVAESRLELAGALREGGLQVAEDDGLSALGLQAEHHIQAVDGAMVRRETLSGQLHAARSLAGTLKMGSEDARAEAGRWSEAWTNALKAADLAISDDIGTVTGALELIALIEEKQGKMRQIRVERIEAMNADLRKFSAEAERLAQIVAPELRGLPAARVAQELARRLSRAHEAHTEEARLRGALRTAGTQAAKADESIQTATASLRPLMERAGVDSNALLADAILRSDKKRFLAAEMAKAKAKLLDGGDGLTRAQVEEEVDAADLTRLAADLAGINDALAEAVQRQSVLAADHANAERALSEIGGSDAAARAEAQRQEALAQMSEVAERYVRVFTAGRLLRWAIDRYREEKQGPLLARAGAIFVKLTLGSFQRLVVDFEREPMALEGQRTDGKLVPISGMSDGTRDQLYLALRLAALEMHLDQALPLPFIADDLFINYDDIRAKAGLEALAALSEQTQVIFLSHHDHLVPAVRDIFGKQVNVVVL